MSPTRITDLKTDVEELNSLLSQSTRQRIKDLLSIEIRKVQTEICRLQEECGTVETVKPSHVPPPQKCYEVKLSNYAWDQSDNFVKIFVTLKNVDTLPAENVFSSFTESSMELHMNGLDNRNYVLHIKNLLEKIDASKSNWKVKKDMVVVSLAKVNTGSSWSHLTQAEKKAKELKKPVPKMDSEGDPTSGLMDLMKQMYDDGDDEMKRTIAKAWTESRGNSAMPSF